MGAKQRFEPVLMPEQHFASRIGHIDGHLAPAEPNTRHCARGFARCIAVMRHYLGIGVLVSAPPRLLPRRVFVRSAPGALIARPGSTKRRASGQPRTFTRAVHLPVVAIAANDDLHPATRADILPVASLAHRSTQNPGQIGAVRA